MEEYLHIIKDSPLFAGIDEADLRSVLDCLCGTCTKYAKDEIVHRVGDVVHTIGMVLCGGVYIIKEDVWGNRNILAKIESGNYFAETYACTANKPLDVSVVAAGKTEILFLDIIKIMTVCSSTCTFHSRLIRNLLSVLAEKNLMMNRKIELMSKRSIREKLLSYLSEQALNARKPYFEIPYNRQQLADYLSVDRSALSKELSKMSGEGLLSYQRNVFKLKI